ncbi:diguanylate cyclase DosC [mine drainage metagenome]|uniref:Diguanylate cyclase DosC n=1 Tax=mine drainage metagenome TaxID=410659 RepID=A0A1J5QDY2_9ZZZZ
MNAPPPAEHAAPRADSAADNVRTLLAAAPMAATGSMFAALAVSWLLRAQVAPARLAAWVLALALVHAARLALARHGRRHLRDETALAALRPALRASALAQGLCWAALPALLWPPSVSAQLFIGIVIASIGGSAMVELAADMLAAAAFIVPPTLALVVQYAQSPEPLLRAMSVLGVANTSYLLLASYRTHRMVSRVARQRAHATERALVDALTALPNRAGFRARLAEALARAQRHGRPLALAYLDLNDFKPVNDRHGHAAGDAVLCEVAQRWRDACRGGDVVARIGGDEFALLLADVAGIDDAAQALTRLRAALEAPCTLPGGGSARIGVTIGLAWARAEDDPDSLMQRADHAMYLGKQHKDDPRGWWESAA